jgi:hypothetical protein
MQIKHRLTQTDHHRNLTSLADGFPGIPVHTTKLDTHLRNIIHHNNGQHSVSSAGHHADLRLPPAFAIAFHYVRHVPWLSRVSRAYRSCVI